GVGRTLSNSTRCQWTGVTRIPKSEVLLWFLELLLHSVDEMVSVPGQPRFVIPLINFPAIGGELYVTPDGVLGIDPTCSSWWLVLGLLCLGSCKQRDQGRP